MMTKSRGFVNRKHRRLLRLTFSVLHGAAAGLLTQGVLLALAAGLAHVGWRVTL
jgi:hypothetical protein